MTLKKFNQRRACRLNKRPNRKRTISADDAALTYRFLLAVLKRCRMRTVRRSVLTKWWDSKLLSLAQFVPFYDGLFNETAYNRVNHLATEMPTLHSAVVLVWRENRRHDLVRPVTRMRYVLRNRTMVAWQGREHGVGSIKAYE